MPNRVAILVITLDAWCSQSIRTRRILPLDDD